MPTDTTKLQYALSLSATHPALALAHRLCVQNNEPGFRHAPSTRGVSLWDAQAPPRSAERPGAWRAAVCPTERVHVLGAEAEARLGSSRLPLVSLAPRQSYPWGSESARV